MSMTNLLQSSCIMLNKILSYCHSINKSYLKPCVKNKSNSMSFQTSKALIKNNAA